jgi:hypothetical protein
MKIKGKKIHPLLGEIDDIEIEVTDFDFSKSFEGLDLHTKANFLSFIKCPMLPRDKNSQLYKSVIRSWNSYGDKENLI